MNVLFPHAPESPASSCGSASLRGSKASASEWRRETTLKIWLALPRPAEKETVTLLAIYLGFPVGNRLPNEGLCR